MRKCEQFSRGYEINEMKEDSKEDEKKNERHLCILSSSIDRLE